MVKILGSFMLSLMLVSLVLADVGPVRQAQEDVTYGYTDPILSPWGLDVVSWATMPASPALLGRTAAGILGNYMYCFGSGTLINSAVAFNLTTLTWENSTPAPLGVDNWAGVATNDAVYLVGRYTGTGYGSEIQKFTPTAGGPTGTWINVANYPLAGCGMAAAWDGGDYIYAAGGNPTPSTAAYRYSISGNAWTPIASLPSARAYTGGAFVGGKFYVLGGTVAAAANTMLAYDPATNIWTPMANLLENVWFATFSVTFDATHVMSIGGGGGYGSWPATPAVQIYDPATNAWVYETPLPAAYGTNAARYAGGGIAISTGGYTGTFTGTTYRGTGFFGGGTPNVTVTLLPVNPPIIIPAIGGTFEWDITLHNGETTPQTIDVWTIITMPGGSTRPGWGPFLNLTMPAGATINRIRSQNIPDRFPAGAYTYTANIGDHPAVVWDSDSFPFTKSAVGADGWAIGQSTTATPSEYAVHGASPNPFNPTTTLSFALPQAGSVKLSVYNVTGREVATLVNGWRDAGNHEVTFDATGLASGLYIYQLTSGDFHATGKMMLTK
jgi:hypothetical protein